MFYSECINEFHYIWGKTSVIMYHVWQLLPDLRFKVITITVIRSETVQGVITHSLIKHFMNSCDDISVLYLSYIQWTMLMHNWTPFFKAFSLERRTFPTGSHMLSWKHLTLMKWIYIISTTDYQFLPGVARWFCCYWGSWKSAVKLSYSSQQTNPEETPVLKMWG